MYTLRIMCIHTGVQKYYWYRTEENFGGGNVGEFGKSSVIRQTETIQISTYN